MRKSREFLGFIRTVENVKSLYLFQTNNLRYKVVRKSFKKQTSAQWEKIDMIRNFKGFFGLTEIRKTVKYFPYPSNLLKVPYRTFKKFRRYVR